MLLIDACRDDSRDVGEIVTVDNALDEPNRLARMRHPTSSHLLDLEQAIAMSVTLGNAPDKLTVHGIVAKAFELGSAPAPQVVAGAEKLADQIFLALAPGSAEVLQAGVLSRA